MIRRAKQSDKKRIVDLLMQVQAVHAKGRPDIFKQGARKYNDAELNELIGDDGKPIFVYETEDGTVAGYAFCVIENITGSNSLVDRKVLYIDDLCVDENMRGTGIGKALFNYVCEYAKSIKCDGITLNVWRLNEGAVAFYEKCGMKPLKTYMEYLF